VARQGTVRDVVRDGERIRVGVIGLGRAGRVHLEAWRAVPGAEVVAVADPSPAVVNAARLEGFRATADTRELLATQGGLDAVSICTPPAHHASLAIAALEHGLHVLCEKPLATRCDSALRMVRAAAQTGRHLLIATKFRHVPDLLAARELIAGGAIGDLLAFEVDFSSRVDMSGRWNSRRSIAGGGVIIDNGSHAFDLVAFLLAPLANVNATRLKAGQALAVEDSVSVMVELASGLVGRVDLSWSLATQRETYVMVHGTRGTIDIGWRQSRLRVTGREPRVLRAGLYDRHASHVTMMNAFVEVVRGKRPPWITPVECLRAVAAVDASYRSLRSGRWVPVDAIEDSYLEAPHQLRVNA
jgi:predicted dehydrogenase